VTRKKDDAYRVYTDGASRGNPGPAGAGVVILSSTGMEKEVSRFLGERTNNQAEYEALIVALEELRELGAKKAHFFSDSEILVKQLRAEYRIRNEGLKPLFGRVLGLLSNLDAFEIDLVNRRDNKRADQLANFAIDREKSLESSRNS
jgi:ribonuclease HI